MEGQGAISRAIRFAIRAGAFSRAAREYRDAAGTFSAAAEINSAKSKAALNEATGGIGVPSPRLPTRKG